MVKTVHENWREIAEACERSGKSVWEWSKENNIPYTNCKRWLSKLKKENDTEGKPPQKISVWGKVEMRKASTLVYEPYAIGEIPIKLRHGTWILEITQGFDPVLLKQIMKVVEAQC